MKLNEEKANQNNKKKVLNAPKKEPNANINFNERVGVKLNSEVKSFKNENNNDETNRNYSFYEKINNTISSSENTQKKDENSYYK